MEAISYCLIMAKYTRIIHYALQYNMYCRHCNGERGAKKVGDVTTKISEMRHLEAAAWVLINFFNLIFVLNFFFVKMESYM